MQIVIDTDSKLVYITDPWNADEWPGIWAQVPSDCRVDTYDVWPDDVIAAISAEGRTLSYETVIQYTTVWMNGQWQTIGMPRTLYHWSAVDPNAVSVPPVDSSTQSPTT